MNLRKDHYHTDPRSVFIVKSISVSVLLPFGYLLALSSNLLLRGFGFGFTATVGSMQVAAEADSFQNQLPHPLLS